MFPLSEFGNIFFFCTFVVVGFVHTHPARQSHAPRHPSMPQDTQRLPKMYPRSAYKALLSRAPAARLLKVPIAGPGQAAAHWVEHERIITGVVSVEVAHEDTERGVLVQLLTGAIITMKGP